MQHVFFSKSSTQILQFVAFIFTYTIISSGSIEVQSVHKVWNIYIKNILHQFIQNNESTEVQTVGVIRIQLIYSINVLSKYSSLISHRPLIFEGRHIDHRSSKVNTSISEGRHIDLRRSTHRSPKVDTSIFEGRHIVTSNVDLRKAIHRSSKVATSIFESCHIDFRRSKAETSHLQFATEHCPQLPSKSLE